MFIEDSWILVLDVVLLSVLTFLTSFQLLTRKQVLTGRIAFCHWVDSLIMATCWLMLLTDQCFGSRLLDIMRPIPLFVVAPTLKSCMTVLLNCLSSLNVAISLAISVTSITGVMAFQLYKTKLDPATGVTLDTFFTSFISFFVLLESADNFEGER